jgi:molybdate transport system substrate-binding protein
MVSAIVLGMAGCGGDHAKPAAATTAIYGFVAASTKDAVAEIAAEFRKTQPIDVKLNADDSSKLATQIAEGAPAHLFLSANEKWADFVRDKGHVQDRKDLLGNTLVLVVPKGNPASVKSAADLHKAAVKRVAIAGPTVPAGIYARQALKKLDVWDKLEKDRRVVSGENVRVTLTYVERGEAEVGIVYATDARISDRVENVFVFPEYTHDPIRYPLVLLKDADRVPQARAFYDFLAGPRGAEIFRKHGFTVLGGK